MQKIARWYVAKRHLNLKRYTKEKDFWTTTRQLTRLGKVWIDAMFDIYASWNRFSLRISELYPNTCHTVQEQIVIATLFPGTFFTFPHWYIMGTSRPVASRGVGGFSPPGFGQTVTPISTRGADYAPPQYYKPSRIFRPRDGPDIYICKKIWDFTENFWEILKFVAK